MLLMKSQKILQEGEGNVKNLGKLHQGIVLSSIGEEIFYYLALVKVFDIHFNNMEI